jgi:hypothetical protein
MVAHMDNLLRCDIIHGIMHGYLELPWRRSHRISGHTPVLVWPILAARMAPVDKPPARSNQSS